ncbi:hypothetical protein EJC49_09760 [Aquibium carbonis]|uniref:Transcriptional regulator-like domain-containing protein n=1 Tax=Aquibium carbonis TaxID=2495581 RepID=A0A3S0G963_9HYPH|nr:DUF6499 domain-containing protein [Aquibium carbonis]RST86558.1 hypothetical protein EJC49_09760 [Aquibium carbonis]
MLALVEIHIPIIRLHGLPTALILESSRWQRPGGEDFVMEPLHDWRSPQFEERLGRLDRGGVSFEFLRRNREYRQDYADTLAGIASGGSDKAEAIARLSRRWGLSFSGGPFCIGLDRSARVATPALPCGRHCHGCPRRLCSFFAS